MEWETEAGPEYLLGPKEDPVAVSWEDSEAEPWSDREAWRGDVYTPDDSSWRQDQAEAWEEVEAAEEHVEEWPENLAGPEYWMFKKREE